MNKPPIINKPPVYFDLVFNIPSERAFSYLGDEKGEAAVGRRAMVPFGGRDCLGYIVSQKDSPPTGMPSETIKRIRRVVDKEPVFDGRDIELAKWIAGYYFCGLGQALQAMIPSGKRATDFSSLAGEEEITASPLALSDEQQRALDAIIKKETPESSGTAALFYLFGITGSGKTEVFLRAAEAMLKEGKSVIYLVPEISLTHQTADVIWKRFGNTAATIHSGMSPAARLSEWMRIRTGQVKIVVGPRSAVFAPVLNLGLIIIDEEHDGSYKSGNTPRYHARQTAMRRCAAEGARLLMGSATPSAEAWKLMKDGVIKRLDLSRRLSGGQVPDIIPVSLEKTRRLPYPRA